MPAASLLIAASALVVLVLGLIHLLYTFHGTLLHPRDPALQAAMAANAMQLTPATTVWKAWVGFNASHSYGAILFGLAYGYLALARPAVLFGSVFLLVLGAGVLVAYLHLAWQYWFRIPLAGIALAAALYLLGLLLSP